MEAYFTLTLGQQLAPPLWFHARSATVDNAGWQWVHFPDVEAWVAPFTRGAVIGLGYATNAPRVDTTPPPGSLVQSADAVTGVFTQIGRPAVVRFSSANAQPSPGYQLPLPTSLTGRIGWAQTGVPASDPWTVAANQNLQNCTGSFLPNVWLDLVALTLSFQSGNVNPGVVTVTAQVGNGPVLALPPNGIIQQSFPPGAMRTFAPRTPLLAPLLQIASAGGGSVLLTAGNQAVQAQATYQVALV